jgi:nicotinamide mononucleotide transporter
MTVSAADALAWADPWLAPWWSAWGVPVSQLEAAAFVLSLIMVGLNLRVSHWAWPFSVLSSVLYGVLFARSRLYGEACLQVFFVLLSVWGWWCWWRGRGANSPTQGVRLMGWRARGLALLSWALMWPALGFLLACVTDSDVPYADALPTAGSVVGQVLLGLKRVENWPFWLLVNLLSMALFAHKGLWLTVGLYGLFAALSVVGWRQWLSMARRGGAAA